MARKDRSNELKNAITKMSGISQRYATDTATFHGHVADEIATEQQHLQELTKRLQSGEDSPDLSEEYVESVSRLAELYEHLAALSEDVDENKRYRGQADD